MAEIPFPALYQPENALKIDSTKSSQKNCFWEFSKVWLSDWLEFKAYSN